ncbi:MAG: UDP-N-acetylmuramoyl-L-alanine--D-glutamate ligase [Pseudomonadota bacterium]
MKNKPLIFDYNLKTLLVGLGETGYSCAKFLSKKNCPFDICDTRETPPYLAQLNKELPEITVLTSVKLDQNLLQSYQQIVISPGISVKDKLYEQFKQSGKLIIGDIVLFIQENLNTNNKPIIAVTGSNGKSTVVTLAEQMLKKAGHQVSAGGNLGVPALDLLEMEVEIYILELSSFQLETIPEEYFQEEVFDSAVLLNVSEDHMDRYESLEDYRKVKESIFKLSKHCVFNKNEWLLDETLKEKQHLEFSLGKPDKNGFGLINENGVTYLVQDICSHQSPSYKKIMPVSEIAITGKHNYSNILATLALLEPFVLSYSSMIAAIQTYKGLAHRCEWVANIGKVDFYNDSKGTNVGATIAAINSYERPKLLIAGGVGKNADFSELGKIINQKIKHVLLFGQDAELIKSAILNEQQLNNNTKNEQSISSQTVTLVSIEIVKDIQQAVSTAQQLAREGDLVLFSPACASFDMYKNYIERGEDFVFHVEKQVF